MKKSITAFFFVLIAFQMQAQIGTLSTQDGFSMNVKFKTFDENFCYYQVLDDSLLSISKTKITSMMAFHTDSIFMKSTFELLPIWKKFYRQLPPSYIKDGIAKYEVMKSLKAKRTEEYCEILIEEEILSSGQKEKYIVKVDYGNGYEMLYSNNENKKFSGIAEVLNLMNENGWIYIDRLMDKGLNRWNMIILLKRKLKNHL